jgi:hypothetical protein
MLKFWYTVNFYKTPFILKLQIGAVTQILEDGVERALCNARKQREELVRKLKNREPCLFVFSVCLMHTIERTILLLNWLSNIWFPRQKRKKGPLRVSMPASSKPSILVFFIRKIGNHARCSCNVDLSREKVAKISIMYCRGTNIFI